MFTIMELNYMQKLLEKVLDHKNLWWVAIHGSERVNYYLSISLNEYF